MIVFGGDLVDATKFTLSGGYLKAGDRYVAIDGGALVVVETSGEATSGWILSGDHLFFGEDPELVHFYGCEGKVSVDSSGGCEEITLIVIKNFEFVPVENTVDGSLPMAISGTLDEASVILSTDNDEVIVFGGDLVDATKFTLSGRYLKAGDRYVAIDGGALVVVETSGEATSGWILSGDHLFFGEDPELVHFYGCEGKVSVDSSGGCEEITLIVIKNFNFEAQINTVDPTNAMLIQGQFDSQEVTISTSGDEVTVFTGDDVDAAKFTIVNRYLKAGDRYVAINGGSLVVVGDEGDAQRGWILSGTTCSSGKTLNWFISMAARVRFLLTAPADAKRSR